MQLASVRNDEASLVALGNEATALLCARNFELLAERFGYAVALGTPVASAIQADLVACLGQAGDVELTARSVPVVKYVRANDSGLHAVIESVVSGDNGARVLLELVVTKKGKQQHATLEQISAAV